MAGFNTLPKGLYFAFGNPTASGGVFKRWEDKINYSCLAIIAAWLSQAIFTKKGLQLLLQKIASLALAPLEIEDFLTGLAMTIIVEVEIATLGLLSPVYPVKFVSQLFNRVNLLPQLFNKVSLPLGCFTLCHFKF